MTLEEFEAALDLHGASVADWPEAERLGAAAVLARSAEARAPRRSSWASTASRDRPGRARSCSAPCSRIRRAGS